MTERQGHDGARRLTAHGELRRLRVAIDGPAGAGKGTVARGLAERLGYLLVDTGALYRAVALAVQRAGFSWDDSGAIGALAEELARGGRIALERGAAGAAPDSTDAAQSAPGSGPASTSLLGGSGLRVLLDGEDVSSAIRAPQVSLGASRVSAVPAVRQALLAMQRQAGAEGGVVLEGRDIGTVVFPDAEVKFFLTAPAEIRAKRRYDELVARGMSVSFEATLSDVLRRDKADSERAVAPLRKADDAILVDSGHRSPQEIIDEMARVVETRARGG
ncbi:cytidylate kinase [Sorangium cellulosum]|uniref:Cytidylate kinase n=1 Tax=Sorangium cellulosum TaxID=56 RepID=A0A4P2Q8L4_SORCE|nr:(d)CMP kinase [Sorangium cellulosum]AUX25528.1 cytidylate kinase [Sorangium cellulosum]